ncbi:shikimate dehydrogenase [Mycetocola sp. CAN_C7]|uniref:shikimate dehydrogenase n=1 Tax=Mycetocola sp. CAN_C7 TaxID=2787724 RepID=UPI0018CB65A5
MSTERLAVFGSPIAHSRSPLLHRTAYDLLGLSWEYGSQEVGAADLAGIVAGLDDGWRGLSLTMPLKSAAWELADSRDRLAELTGAVNTLRFTGVGPERRLFGYNTDVAGIVRSLAAVGVSEATHVQILGGGATAASAVVAAAELGALSVSILARDPQKSAPLVDLGRRVGLTVELGLLDDIGLRAVPQLVVNTLPGSAPAPVVYPDAVLTGAALLAVAYEPWPSDLASQWQAAGGTVANGLSMLVHQALIQIRIFVSNDPFAPLDGEDTVLDAMLASVGLDSSGIPIA